MPHSHFDAGTLPAHHKLLCLASVVALLLATPVTKAQTTDDESEIGPRWDDKYFGFEVEKPRRGRLWKVSATEMFTDGARLQEGDEILEINGTRVTVKDDLIQILQEADDEIEIRAKRKQGRDRKVGRATFRRTTRWESIKAAFDVKKDQIRDSEVLRINEAVDAVAGQTHLLPEIVIKDGHPDYAILRFQYRDDDWLFIRKLTIKCGDEQFVIERNPLTGVKQEIIGDGTVKEWFAIGDEDALRILLTVGLQSEEECIVRMHGKDYYDDFKLSPTERASFTWSALLWVFGQQRQQDLEKSN